MQYNLRKRAQDPDSINQSTPKVRKQPTNNNNNNQPNDNNNNADLVQPQQSAPLVERPLTVSGNVIICQLLQATDMFFSLDFKTIFALTLTSKAVLQQLIPFISQHYTFYYPEYRPLNFYHPRKLIVKAFNLKTLRRVPFLDNLREIVFHDNFNSPVKKLPSTVTRITFGTKFKQELKGKKLPPGLTHLSMGYCFNSPLSNLPHTLQYLKFDFMFNKTVSFPPNLIHLEFDYFYNQSVDGLHSLTSLTHLIFGGNFNMPINKLPQSLLFLKLGDEFDYPLSDLPRNLEHLHFGESFNEPLSDLPLKLTHIKFNYRFNQAVSKHNLPSSLTHIEFGISFNKNVDNLPQNITHIEFSRDFQQTIAGLPPKIKQVVLHIYYKQPIEHLLSPNINFLMRVYEKSVLISYKPPRFFH
eukprot:TRINITY_DN310_c0_g1_i1.p1 TRINITY_DN310_c0_g1~~TRINITY_DN310_c0_g1_i1.p1  ORF type:complete len:412 (-),score=52.07 TRINITY_DN310_c0_g1_i1:290-1525(-)